MKDRLNAIYQELLIGREQNDDQHHIIQLMALIMENVKDYNILGSVWNASVKTIIKLLQYKQVVEKV